MKRMLLLLAVLLMVGCGRGKDGDDGRDGNDGKPGENGKPGGSIEVPIEKPIPSPLPEDVDQTLNCNLKWELTGAPAGRYYDLKYKVLKTKAKEAFASLKIQYHAGAATMPEQTVEKKYSSSVGFDSAIVSTLVWQASLSGTKAIFRNFALNSDREVTCTF